MGVVVFCKHVTTGIGSATVISNEDVPLHSDVVTGWLEQLKECTPTQYWFTSSHESRSIGHELSWEVSQAGKAVLQIYHTNALRQVCGYAIRTSEIVRATKEEKKRSGGNPGIIGDVVFRLRRRTLHSVVLSVYGTHWDCDSEGEERERGERKEGVAVTLGILERDDDEEDGETTQMRKKKKKRKGKFMAGCKCTQIDTERGLTGQEKERKSR